MPYRLWTKEEVEELNQLYPSASSHDLINRLKRSWETIQKKAQELDIRRPYMRSGPRLDLEEIKRLYLEEKLSCSQIANRFGCNQVTVWQKLHQINCVRSLSEAAQVAYAMDRRACRPLKGELHPNWGGGRVITGRGYVLIMKPEHPKADPRGYVTEHLLVWEQTHKKPLPEGWVIHHLNSIKGDNRPCNLVAFPNNKHSAKHGQLVSTLQQKIRELEVENKQLRRAFEDGQMPFTISEN